VKTALDLAARLGIDNATCAIAAQTMGLNEFLRKHIIATSETRIVGRNPAGKAETAGEAFERVTGDALHRKVKRASK